MLEKYNKIFKLFCLFFVMKEFISFLWQILLYACFHSSFFTNPLQARGSLFCPSSRLRKASLKRAEGDHETESGSGRYDYDRVLVKT